MVNSTLYVDTQTPSPTLETPPIAECRNYNVNRGAGQGGSSEKNDLTPYSFFARAEQGRGIK